MFRFSAYALLSLVFLMLGVVHADPLSKDTRIEILNTTIASQAAAIANLTAIVNSLPPAPTRTTFTMYIYGPWTGGVALPGVVLSASGSLRTLDFPGFTVDVTSGTAALIYFGNFDAYPYPNSPPNYSAQVGAVTVWSGASSRVICQVQVGQGSGTIFNGAIFAGNTFPADGNQLTWQSFAVTWTV